METENLPTGNDQHTLVKFICVRSADRHLHNWRVPKNKHLQQKQQQQKKKCKFLFSKQRSLSAASTRMILFFSDYCSRVQVCVWVCVSVCECVWVCVSECVYVCIVVCECGCAIVCIWVVCRCVWVWMCTCNCVCSVDVGVWELCPNKNIWLMIIQPKVFYVSRHTQKYSNCNEKCQFFIITTHLSDIEVNHGALFFIFWLKQLMNCKTTFCSELNWFPIPLFVDWPQFLRVIGL